MHGKKLLSESNNIIDLDKFSIRLNQCIRLLKINSDNLELTHEKISLASTKGNEKDILKLRQKGSSEKDTLFFGKIINCDPSIYTMDHPDFIVCSFMENSIGSKRVKGGFYACVISTKNSLSLNWIFFIFFRKHHFY